MKLVHTQLKKDGFSLSSYCIVLMVLFKERGGKGRGGKGEEGEVKGGRGGEGRGEEGGRSAKFGCMPLAMCVWGLFHRSK